MNTYTLFWLDGKSEVVKGIDIVDAYTKAGYSNGAISALDFYDFVDARDKWVWDEIEHKWKSKQS